MREQDGNDADDDESGAPEAREARITDSFPPPDIIRTPSLSDNIEYPLKSQSIPGAPSVPSAPILRARQGISHARARLSYLVECS